MKYSLTLLALSIALALTAAPRRAIAQIVIIDDVILMTSRQKKMQEMRTHQHLSPPGGDYRLSAGPGADTPRLGEERIAVMAVPGLLAGRRTQMSQDGARLRLAPLPTLRSAEIPLYGDLELPAEEEEGPADGLSLDAAIERLLTVNYTLAAKYQDIPKARADILTAGLRNNPFVFVSASNLPYQRYSPQRPGTASYDLTVIQPLDVSGKHRNAVLLAQEAKEVLEAEYQDAVRLEIDKLYTAYADVLEAREAVRAARAGVSGLEELVRTTRDLFRQGLRAAGINHGADAPNQCSGRFAKNGSGSAQGAAEPSGVVGSAARAGRMYCDPWIAARAVAAAALYGRLGPVGSASSTRLDGLPPRHRTRPRRRSIGASGGHRQRLSVLHALCRRGLRAPRQAERQRLGAGRPSAAADLQPQSG